VSFQTGTDTKPNGEDAMPELTKDTLTAAAAEIFGDDVTKLPLERLEHLITVTQYATDVLLNEIERRGELTFAGDVPIIPYMSDYSAETILARPGEDWPGAGFPDLPRAPH